MTESTGGCLCGAVRYRVRDRLRPVVFCHCDQCRLTSGHYVAATACRRASLDVTGEERLTWYRSSASAERGFCSVCGSNLFWRPIDGAGISIMAGTLDTPTGLAAKAHIFVASASDYYAIDDGLPSFDDRGNVDVTAIDAADAMR